LAEVQIGARVRVTQWVQAGEVNKAIARSFEEDLYKRFKEKEGSAEKAGAAPVMADEDSKIEAAACYAVAMALEANRRVGRIGLAVMLVSGALAMGFKSIWPLAGGFLIGFLVFRFVIGSCLRYVEQKVGMPAEIQAHYSRQYKADPEFAKKVNAFVVRWKSVQGSL
jgi:hypothetical protein